LHRIINLGLTARCAGGLTADWTGVRISYRNTNKVLVKDIKMTWCFKKQSKPVSQDLRGYHVNSI